MKMEDVMKAANRYEVVMKVEHGMVTMGEAATLLGLSLRQMRRVKRRAETEGLTGLLYQRSHNHPHRVSEEERATICDLRRERYRAFNLLHVRDILKHRHGIERSREFYRKLFLLEQLVQPRPVKKRKQKHRKRFEAPRAGVLIQRDTSIHFWVPHVAKPWKLILDLDDHSRKITGALFSEHDDVLSNMLVAWETISTHGMPFAYYTDNNPIYNPMNKKPKAGMYQFYRWRSGEEKETLSQFKRALHELGIECIHATPYQPQGKGKIERLFRFMQDRLANEMTEAKVITLHDANKHLQRWIEWYNHAHLHSITKQIPNERFLANNAFRPLPGDVDLKNIFCLKYERQVKADNTFSFEGRTYQLQPNAYRISYAKAQIEIRIDPSHNLHVLHQGREIGRYRYKPKDLKTLPTGEDILSLHT